MTASAISSCGWFVRAAFGHNHASAGTARVGQTLYVNASVVDSQYRIARRPFAFEMQDKGIFPVAA